MMKKKILLQSNQQALSRGRTRTQRSWVFSLLRRNVHVILHLCCFPLTCSAPFLDSLLDDLFKGITWTKLTTTLFPAFNFITFNEKWFINWTISKIRCELVDSVLTFAPASDSWHNSPDLVYCSWEAESDIQLPWFVHWELSFSNSPLTLLPALGTTLALLGPILVKLTGLLCMF